MIKRIETKGEKEKKSRRNRWILAGILVFIMIGSTFGIVFQNFSGSGSGGGGESINYNGYTFFIVNGYYNLQTGDANLYFSLNPLNVDSIIKTVETNKTLSDYIGKVIYVSSSDYNSYGEIYSNLGSFAQRIQEACIEGEECLDLSLPIKTCLDKTIVIRSADQNKIYEKENCVYIEGKENDLLGLTDEFILRIFGIK
ncbi:hypothetical protein J4411_02580 [Candidatus Pacearchaeota archaeon]|nr:hypothetical protein [Candidatus Pacearchaeota archaeon]